MADIINKTDVFKFVALRPPVTVDKRNQEKNFINDERPAEKTPVGKLVTSFDKKDGTKIPEQTNDFIKLNKYAINFPENEDNTTLHTIFSIAGSYSLDTFSLDKLKHKIENFLDGSISSFLRKPDTTKELERIWDCYYAFYILSRYGNQNLEVLTQGLRTFHLLNLLSNSERLDFETLQNILTAQPLVNELFTKIPKPLLKVDKIQEEKPDEEQIKGYKKLWTDIIDTHRAIDELKNIKFETKLITETKHLSVPNKVTGVEEKGKLILFNSNLSVDKKSLESLHSSTKSILKNYNINEKNFQIAEPLLHLQDKLNNFYYLANNINDVSFIEYAPIEVKSIQGLAPIIDKYAAFNPPKLLFIPSNVRSSIKPLGIGELKVVKQKLKKYVAGEVAHIENVLRGEYKERKNRVLDRSEDIFSVSNETDEETTKDTQTTERFELKKESEKTIQEQMSVQAGVTVSGSYGMVTFGAHGDFAYSTASQESNKNSSNFAREVVDKSVSKIQKKTKEERTTKKLHEVEEINTHGLDNKGQPDHAIGIYRWVDKYYEAQIYNYGKRMMFEFIIPEPAAFYEYAQTHKPKLNIAPPKSFNPTLTHQSITRENYQNLIRDYNVQGVTTPPLPAKTIFASIVKEGMPLDGNPHTANTKLTIPAGYISKVGLWFDCSAFFDNYPKLEITIGNRIFRLLDNTAGGVGIANTRYNDPTIDWHWYWPESTVEISVNSYDVKSYTLTVYAYVERTGELYEQWQIQTFEKIITAYKVMQAEYEQKKAAQEVQQGIVITGQNPLINRDIERTELKKQCIKMLMDRYLFGSFNAMGDLGDDGKGLFIGYDSDKNPIYLPDFENSDAIDEGKTTQFFEQAFEWENLTYLFYPYFWARKEQWVHKSTIYDNDPLFTKFLQAGSARVVLPVHFAYNDAVMYFLENNGAIWNGGEPPRLNDPLFISLADELKNQTDDLAGATPEGEPWEVVLPTTLVYLQKDSDLPTF